MTSAETMVAKIIQSALFARAGATDSVLTCSLEDDGLTITLARLHAPREFVVDVREMVTPTNPQLPHLPDGSPNPAYPAWVNSTVKPR